MPQERSNIFLIGPMGAGKSSIGKALALVLTRPFIDLDAEIVSREGRSIPEIFAAEGEEGFRRCETEALRHALVYKAVIATGGGVVMKPENIPLLKSGIVCYLRASVEVQYQRTATDRNRPMLQVEDRRARLQEIFDLRDPLYKTACDFEIDSGKGMHECVVKIREQLKRLRPDEITDD